ncbi:MAG: HEPN domain-containing protein [Ignavibacteriales bacterium]|nr:HEPN domain-containing protein [Ignavibacteriales bacterium]
MPRKESLYPADWLRIAEKDFARVEYLLRERDAEAAGFFLQQAVEKFLKAFLLSKGWQLRRVHDLEPLLNEALSFDPSLERYRSILQKITGFYFIERYPFVVDVGLTEDDVRQAFTAIKGLVDAIKSHLEK